MASCNPTDLLVAGKCFDCLSPGLKETIKLQLLCQIANGSGDSGITQLTGDVTAGPGSGSQVATIAAGAVTLAKMANIATNTVIGRSTAGTGAPEALTSITPASAAFSGTAGAGFVSLLTQSSVPAAPATGFALYADSSGRLSWRRATDGFTRSFDVTATANRTFTLPDASFTFAGQNLANTFSLAQVFSANGALSAPAVSFTGTPITGGTATTTKPLVLIETAGATSTGWNTSGTMFGINSSGGSLLLFDFQANGSSRLSLSSGGNLVQAAAGALQWLARGILTSPSAGAIQLGNADTAAPVAQTLSVQSVVAGTTDTAGVNWTFKGSGGTGAGAGGELRFQVAPAGSTGSSQNAFITGLRVTTRSGCPTVYLSAYGNSYEYYNFAGTSPLTPVDSSTAIGQAAYSRQGTETTSDYGYAFVGNNRTNTAGTHTDVVVQRGFAPTSGTGVYVGFAVQPTINQTGGANGITRALYINPTLTAAADFRALEITDGNVVLPKTITAGGTTGAQTINKVTGSVNFAAAATSLVVTNAYVTANSNIQCTIATNDATAANVKAVAGAGSFTIYLGTAPTAETRVNFTVTN